jgi:hypothetical protein
MRHNGTSEDVTVRARTNAGHVLREVEIIARHPRHSSDVVYLDADQLPAVLADMSIAAYSSGPANDHHCHAHAWHVHGEDGWSDGEEVLRIESSTLLHGEGSCAVTREQEQLLFKRLEAIALEYLHENVWGGEDARDQ